MMLSGLCSVALLLAIPTAAQQSSSPAPKASAPAQATQPVPQSEAPITEIKVECVPASHAADLIGKHGCVAGRVSRVTTPKSGSTHLSLCPRNSDCDFHIVVFAGDSAAVGDLTYLRGKLVAIVGDVKKYRGEPEIVMKERNQLKVLADDAPSQFDAAQSKPSSKGQPSNASRGGRIW